MGRRKVEQKFIENRGLRSSTYQKRIQGLKKKTYELATLCDVPAFLISFGPDGQVETWPESSEEIKDIIRRYNSAGATKVSNKNKLNAQGLLELEIKQKRKELKRMAMDPADRLQEPIKSLDPCLGEVSERMQLLGTQSLTETLEEWKLTLMDNFEGDDAVKYNQNIGLGATVFETSPALQDSSTVHDVPTIRFWELLADSSSVSDTFQTNGEVFEQESDADFVSLEDCFDDSHIGGFGSQSESESPNPGQILENRNSGGFDPVFTQTEAMGLSTMFLQADRPKAQFQNDGFGSLYEYMDLDSSITASPFGVSFGSVEAQVVVDNDMQFHYEALTSHEHPSITDELLLADGSFYNCQLMGDDDAQQLCGCSEFGLNNALQSGETLLQGCGYLQHCDDWSYKSSNNAMIY